MIQIAKITNYKQFIEYDIAHVIDLPSDVSYSINKIIKNLIKNVKLKQVVFSTIDFGYGGLIRVINDLNIKIIHLHSNSSNIVSCLKKQVVNAKIIQTIHSNVESILGFKADKIICIHNEAYMKNFKYKNSHIIENTVELPILLKEEFNFNKSIVTNCRIDSYYITSDNIEVYKQILAEYYIYGYSKKFDIHTNNFNLLNESIKNTRIKILPWTDNVEEILLKHDIYGFYQPKYFPKLCYGLSIMEAAVIGMPIVALERRQDYQQYIKDGYNGFIVKDDKEFIKRINQLIHNKNLFNEFALNAQYHAKTLKNNMPEQYMKVYEEFLK